jgi:hypothetical protein
MSGLCGVTDCLSALPLQSASTHTLLNIPALSETSREENVCAIECMAASAVSWSHFLAANPEVPGSIPGATKFSE